MFNQPQFAASGRHNPFANAYVQVAAETSVACADPHRLVAMLFDAYFEALAQAKGALQSGHIEHKSRAVGRAVRIVEEGLRAGLDLKAGGQLAADLNELYAYLATRLTLANLRNDPAMLDECQQLVEPLREAWMAIGASVANRP